MIEESTGSYVFFLCFRLFSIDSCANKTWIFYLLPREESCYQQPIFYLHVSRKTLLVSQVGVSGMCLEAVAWCTTEAG
jgi:hypothetical protein